MKGKLTFTIVMVALSLLIWSSHQSVRADNAADLDYHKDVRAAYAIADASSGICAEVDALGNLQVDINAIGSEKAEDVAHVTADKGIPAMVVRADTADSLCGTDGDYSMLLVDAYGRLHVLDKNSADLLTAAESIYGAIAYEDAALAMGILIQGDDGTDRHNIATDTAGILNVNAFIAGTTVDGNSGNKSAQTQRVVIATDDINLAAIKTATESIYGAVAYEDAALDMGILFQGDDGTDRKNVAVDTDGNIQVDIVTDQALTAAADSVTATPVAGTGVVVITNDAVVKGSPGTLYGVMVSFDAVTAGDTVEIENHASADSGTSLMTFVAQAADQNFAFQPCVGIAYAAGIYCDFTLSGGAATVSLVYE